MSMPNLGDIGQNVGEQVKKINDSEGLNKSDIVKALEQVNDSLIIIQKEIQYAIGHLGFDNMPVVQTTVEGIVTKVEDNSGSIATLVQSGKELSQQIENTKILVGKEIKNVTELIGTKAGDLDNKYTRLINEINTNVSKISQKADEIVLTVESTKKTIADGIAKINEKTGELEGKIASVESSISKIDQKADSITLTVKNQKVEFDQAIADTQVLIGKTTGDLDTKLQGQITSLTTSISKVDQKADSITSTVSTQKIEVEKSIAETKQLVTDTASNLDTKIQGDISTANGNLDNKLLGDITNANNALDSKIQKQLVTITNSVSSIDQKADSIASTVQTHREEIETSISNANQLIVDKTTELDSKLKGDITNATTELDSKLKGDITNATTELDSKLKGDITNATSDLDKKLQGDITNANDTLNKTIQTQLVTITNSISKIDQKADGITSTVSTQKTQFEKAISNTNELITTTTSELDNKLQGDISTATTELGGKLKSDISTATTELDSKLKGDITNATSDLDKKLQGQIGTITTSVSSIDQKADNINLSVQEVKTDLNGKVDTSDFTGEKIISQINIDTSGTIISGDKVRLKGKINEISSPSGELKLILSDYIGADGQQHSKLLVETNRTNPDGSFITPLGVIDDPYYSNTGRPRVYIGAEVLMENSMLFLNKTNASISQGVIQYGDNSILDYGMSSSPLNITGYVRDNARRV